MKTADSTPFPCPFCQSSRVTAVGSGLVFVHYECGECREVWTAMAVTPKVRRPAARETDDPAQPGIATKPAKLWLN